MADFNVTDSDITRLGLIGEFYCLLMVCMLFFELNKWNTLNIYDFFLLVLLS